MFQIKLPKNSIITGASALSMHGFISYSPSRFTLEMPSGTSVSKYPEYKITTQSLDTINLGKVTLNQLNIYCPERLLVEIFKFDLENTIRAEAIRNLEKICNPVIVKRYFELLSPKRRGINYEYIKDYLSRKLGSIVEKLKVHSESQQKDILREYLLSRLGDLEIPILIKGGSSIELFSEIKRSTLDVDAHVGLVTVEQILFNLSSKDYEIYFEPTQECKEEITNLLNGTTNKNIVKLNLIPKTRLGSLKTILGIHSDFVNDLSLNLTYSLDELKQIILDFRLSRRQLKYFKNKSCITFSREMLLAEKFQSLISKPENTHRTKDLIDLKLLYETFDRKQFIDWFFKKYSSGRNAIKDKEEIKQVVKRNIALELSYIKDNFSEAVKMYGAVITFEECKDIYNELANIILNTDI